MAIAPGAAHSSYYNNLTFIEHCAMCINDDIRYKLRHVNIYPIKFSL